MERHTRSFDVSDQITVTVSKFRGIVYFHISDKSRNKFVSLKREDFLQMCRKREALLDFANKAANQKMANNPSKKKKHTPEKSQKHRTRNWDDNDDDDGAKYSSECSEY